jgi:hypothetical protein
MGFIVVVKERSVQRDVLIEQTVQIPDVFLLQPLMPPSLFRNINMTSGTNRHCYR